MDTMVAVLLLKLRILVWPGISPLFYVNLSYKKLNFTQLFAKY